MAAIAFSRWLSAVPLDKKPNIVFIIIDDMGWKDMGCAGSTYFQTPHIDRLASQGLRFENAYSAAPVCSPSRGAIFSGKNPARTKFTNVFSGKAAPDDRLYKKSKYRGGNDQYFEALHRHNLPQTETTFAEVLARAGYATGFFGKWHCGVREDYRPDMRGFQLAQGYRTKHVGTGTSRHWGRTFKKYAANMPDIPDEAYVADLLTDECINFIQENRNRPFLAVLSHYLVHSPIEPKPAKAARYEKRPTTDQCHPGYAAVIESVDESLGRLMNTLKELGIDENTMVVFTSDNGSLTPKYTSNYPLMGGKSFPFEAGTKVPLLIRWPKVVNPGTVKQRVIGMDFYPTFLEAAGLPLKPDQHIDGVSVLKHTSSWLSSLTRSTRSWNAA